MDKFNLSSSGIDRALNAAKYIQRLPIEKQLAQITRYEKPLQDVLNQSLVGYEKNFLLSELIEKMQDVLDDYNLGFIYQIWSM